MTVPDTLSPFHAQNAQDAVKNLNSAAEGLSAAEATARLALHGPNTLPQPKGDTPLMILWRQFNNPIAWVLVGAGVLAVALGKYTDSIVVWAAIGINAIIGFIQEYRAGKAIAALAQMVPENATVVRDGHLHQIPSANLVPGNIVELTGGDKVPADLRLLRVKGLHADEAPLTGESVPVAKHINAVAQDASIGDRTCLVFGGTLITQGTATGIVAATGAKTELGRINALLNQTTELVTPLTRQLEVVSKWMTYAIIFVSVAMFLVGWLLKGGKPGDALFTAVTLAVAAIPEGLPAIITIALAIGVRRMAARRAVVRHLPAVETLGSTTVICSDKTGTLTRNEMTVQSLWCGGHGYHVSGIGYAPSGIIEHEGAKLDPAPPAVADLLTASVLCNDSSLRETNGEWAIGGDPTEAAMLVVARKAGFIAETLRSAHPRIDVIPFDSDTKYMASWNRSANLDKVFLKGAPESVYSRCNLSSELLAEVEKVQLTCAESGMRVLAFASRNPDPGMTELSPEWAASGFTFLGLMGMIDPPRQEAIDAIATCHHAGITVKMITGDHHATALAIGRQLGIAGERDHALSGKELDRLDPAAFAEAARTVNIFARVAPEHKIRLVETLQSQGHIVAMTGDGVNDAPALKRADIGVAMGITGTAVSKEASKIVLTDDNFASIAAAVEEGRRVYDNLVKALAFVIPTNIGLAAILAGGMFLFPAVKILQLSGINTELLLPMSPTQILWINLVAAVALSAPIAFEVLEAGSMRRPPRKQTDPIFSGFVAARTIYIAILMALAACGLFLWSYLRAIGEKNLGISDVIPADLHKMAVATAQTTAVTTVVMFQIFYLFHCRSLREGLSAPGWFSNPAIWLGSGILLILQFCFIYIPFMQTLFNTAPMSLSAWLEATAAATVVLLIVSAEKWYLRRR